MKALLLTKMVACSQTVLDCVYIEFSLCHAMLSTPALLSVRFPLSKTQKVTILSSADTFSFRHSYKMTANFVY